MARIISISASSLDEALSGTTRQYLAGRLQKPQSLQHIDTDLLEIGLTRYTQDTIENPHYHRVAHEFQYVTRGFTVYLDVETSREYRFSTGDFYLIEPGVQYAQKSKAGTEILFIKLPPGNDKVDLPVTPELRAWYEMEF